MKIIQQVSRLYPVYKGKGWIAQCKAFRKYAESLKIPCEAKLHDGQIILVNPLDYIGAMLFLFGDLDPGISSLIKRLLKPGDTFVDVGANIGVETIPASRLCGNEGRVFAFEPNPNVFKLLLDSLELNDLCNVTCFNVAASEEAKTLFFSVPANNTGSAQIVSEIRDNTFCVKALRLDALEELQNRPIKLLKIDVEGHEKNVLKGCEGLLRQGTIENLLIEIWHSENNEFMDNESVKRLMQFGFTPFQLLKKLSIFTHLVDLTKHDVAKGSSDFLFMRT